MVCIEILFIRRYNLYIIGIIVKDMYIRNIQYTGYAWVENERDSKYCDILNKCRFYIVRVYVPCCAYKRGVTSKIKLRVKKCTYYFMNRLITTYNYFMTFSSRIGEENEIKVKLSSLTFI